MKTIKNHEVAEWLGLRGPTLSNIFNRKRFPSVKTAQRLAEVSGVGIEDWLLSDGNLLKKKVLIAYTMSVKKL